MNTSNGFNRIQMFAAFLPEDFQTISQGQLKTALRRFRSPAREAATVLGPRADTPNAAEQPCEGRRCRAGCSGCTASGRGPQAGEGEAAQGCTAPLQQGGRGARCLLRQVPSRPARRRGPSALWPSINRLLKLLESLQ